MAIKEYFCKVSWDKNDIVRSHANITVELDLTDYCWVVTESMRATGGSYESRPNFTIDFMIETGA